jgi:hypothetical protein
MYLLERCMTNNESTYFGPKKRSYRVYVTHIRLLFENSNCKCLLSTRTRRNESTSFWWSKTAYRDLSTWARDQGRLKQQIQEVGIMYHVFNCRSALYGLPNDSGDVTNDVNASSCPNLGTNMVKTSARPSGFFPELATLQQTPLVRELTAARDRTAGDAFYREKTVAEVGKSFMFCVS